MRFTALFALTILPAALAAQNPAAAPAAAQAPAPLPPNGWRIDPGHSRVAFRVRHMGMEWVTGEFERWTGDFVYDPAHPESASVAIHIQAASETSQNDRRDNDVRANYLNVDSFPDIAFVSRQVERVDSTHLRVAGDLTLHGVTRPVVLATELLGTLSNPRARRIAFTATTQLNRQEFGMTRNFLIEGAKLVGDDIYITIDLVANQPVAQPSGTP